MSEYFNSLTQPPALIGVISSILVLVSMCFNPRTVKGETLMRSVNLVASIVSVVYGLMIGLTLGAGVILLNGVLVFVNIFYLWKIKKDKTSGQQ